MRFPPTRPSLVPMARIERATSPLPRECSTTEPHGRPTLDCAEALRKPLETAKTFRRAENESDGPPSVMKPKGRSMERETRLELATFCLEGKSSTN